MDTRVNIINLQCPRWTEREIKILKDYYLNTHSDFFDIKELVAQLGRSEAAISRRASRFNLTNPHRKNSIKARQRMSAAQKDSCNSPERKEQISKTLKEMRDKIDHPKGFLGRKHSPATKAKIGKKKKQNWKDPTSAFNKDYYRQSLSDRLSGPKDHTKEPYSRARGGKREDLDNQYFRSAWEANIARYLNFLLKIGQVKSWEYEPDTFWFKEIKRGVRSYTPDFKIDGEYYLEVKGYMDTKSKTKLKRMAKHYPGVKVELVDESRYRQLNKDFKNIIDFWESLGMPKKSKKSGKSRRKSPLQSRRLQ